MNVIGKEGKVLLVGDNPFHGVSHFSQEKARNRDERINDPKWAAELVKTSFENGADGFMFSASETTLSILRMLTKPNKEQKYYAIVPAAADYVRLSSQVGTIGLVRYVANQTLRSRNIIAIANGAKGILFSDMPSLMKAYLGYEMSRIRTALGNKGKIYSLMLHELITEMAVALNIDWLIRSYIEYLNKLGIKPGFETRNFVCLVNKLKELEIDTRNIVITTPFNALGFQMNPSKTDCEKASSVAVYSMSSQFGQGAVFTENDLDLSQNQITAFSPDGGYGWAKLMGEIQLNWTRSLDVGIARIYSVYGVNEPSQEGKAHVIGDLIRKVILLPPNGTLRVYGDGKQSRDFLYVTDCIDALLLLEKKASNPPILTNIGSGEFTTIETITKKVIEVSGKNIKIEYDLTKPVGPVSRTADITRVKNLLHWEPRVSLDEGIRLTYAWLEKKIAGGNFPDLKPKT